MIDKCQESGLADSGRLPLHFLIAPRAGTFLADFQDARICTKAQAMWGDAVGSRLDNSRYNEYYSSGETRKPVGRQATAPGRFGGGRLP